MKILFVTTISNTINAFLIPHIRLLIDMGYKVDVACSIQNPLNKEIIEMGCRIYDIEFERSAFNKNNYIAYKKIKKTIEKGYYNIVHTHTPIASAIARLACKNMKHTKVFYTAHGFH